MFGRKEGSKGSLSKLVNNNPTTFRCNSHNQTLQHTQFEVQFRSLCSIVVRVMVSSGNEAIL